MHVLFHHSSADVISWNTCKKGVDRFSGIAKALNTNWLLGVALLQEIAMWKGGCASHGMVLLSRVPSEKQRGSDCGILIPRRFHPLVRREAHGDYWSGILLGSVVFLSAHIIEHCKEDGCASTLFQETVEFINVCKKH